MIDFTHSRWAITGAAGTIAVPLRQALATLGVTLVSADIKATEPVGATDNVVTHDLADLEGLVTLLDGCDGVIHLGGVADEADFHDLADVNIVGTYHVLEAARRARVPRVVYGSSNRVTGMYDAGTTVSPSAPPRPDGFYGASKVAAEALCRLYADKFDLSTIVMRIGSYEQRPSTARERHTWLSPADAVRAFVAAMTTDVHTTVFYAVSDNSPGWWDLEPGAGIGFTPVDDASVYHLPGTVDPATPQGGSYAEVDYSLDAIRR